MTPEQWAAERVTHLETPLEIQAALAAYLAAGTALEGYRDWNDYERLARACADAKRQLRTAFGSRRGRYKVGNHVVALNAMITRGEDLKVWEIWGRGKEPA